jgi:predicted RNase H-like nuclease (RuvC/YqgF family)
MIREYLPALASVISTIMVFLLGRVIIKGEKRQEASDAVEIAEIGDRAKLSEELWREITALRAKLEECTREVEKLQRDNLELSVRLAKSDLLIIELTSANKR